MEVEDMTPNNKPTPTIEEILAAPRSATMGFLFNAQHKRFMLVMFDKDNKPIAYGIGPPDFWANFTATIRDTMREALFALLGIGETPN